MGDAGECRKCGTSLAPDNIKESVWFPPYCPVCWPKRCPHCNVTEFYWSGHYGHPRCDSGCYINGADFPYGNSPNA